jgi:broad specificity phosphatase PhoE
VTFPGGESLRAMQARAVDAVREHDARVAADAGDSAVWVAVTHGDVVKAVLADALGIHLDAFQRLVADPASVSAVRYTSARPFVLRVNDTGGDVSALVPVRRRRPRTDAVVGGGTGDP